jgi:hypothetical protein
MPNFSSPASTQTDLDFFLTIFQVILNFLNFSEALLNEFKIIQMGNSPSKHRPQFTHYLKLENLCKFGLFLVYRMYLNEKNIKWQEKFDENGPVSAQSDTCFLVQNRSFLNIFTFHLEKHIRKT